jgi:hypothetical protein
MCRQISVKDVRTHGCHSQFVSNNGVGAPPLTRLYECLLQVGWVKADTKAIQAIHDHVITHNPRVSVTHLDVNTWNLHIKAVTEEDRGEMRPGLARVEPFKIPKISSEVEADVNILCVTYLIFNFQFI